MTSSQPALRALVIYGLCVPMAVMLGYLLKDPLTWPSVFYVVAVLGIISIPMLLKWHQPLLVLSWNSAAYAFFIPGRPAVWLVMGALSLALSVLQRTLTSRAKFLHAPSIARPLLFLAAVALVTAELTDGIGLRSFGGEVFGGTRYFTLLGAIVAYFALTARRIPLHRARLYCGLFFLSGVTTVIGNAIGLVSPAFYFIFWIFPPTSMPGEQLGGDLETITRIGGLVGFAVAVVSFLASRYGMRGLLLEGKSWRLAVVVGSIGLGMFSGFRSMLILIALIFCVQFCLEGLLKSRLVPIFLLGGVLAATVVVPLASKLPRSFQRAMAFLPVEIDAKVRADAEASSKWRLEVWKEILPQVPNYLLLGRGYAVKRSDFELVQQGTGITSYSRDHWKAVITGDFHNGPLSVAIPFGLWGVLGFLWLLWAGGRLLYFNYRYGDPALRNINSFLFAAFLAQSILFVFVFGALDSDLYKFTGLLGLSVALNGGMHKPVRVRAAQPVNIRIREPVRPVPQSA